MAVVSVKNVGSQSSNATTKVVTVPAAGCAVGNFLVVLAGCNGNVTVSSVVDTQGNTYAELNRVSITSPNNNTCTVWYSRLGTALVSGNTITLTWSAKVNGSISVEEFSGVTTTTNGTNTGSGTSTTPSVTFTPTNATDLVIANLWERAGEFVTFTQDSDSNGGDTWHAFATVPIDSVGSVLRASYKAPTSVATQTYNPTLGSSITWLEVVGALVSDYTWARERPYGIRGNRQMRQLLAT